MEPPKKEEQKPQRTEETQEETKPQRKKSNKHLKGGISTPTGGEKFGLKW